MPIDQSLGLLDEIMTELGWPNRWYLEYDTMRDCWYITILFRENEISCRADFHITSEDVVNLSREDFILKVREEAEKARVDAIEFMSRDRA